MSAGSTTVEIDLVESDGATTVRLSHHAVADHQRGWAYFLGVLRQALAAG